jgi:3-dehydroquinate synthase
MIIKSRFKEYNVDFINFLTELYKLAQKSETFFVIDKSISQLYKHDMAILPKDRLFLMDAEETEKNMQSVMDICEKMTIMPSKRNTHLVSLGGGIVQDVTGFVASSLYRGIKWTFFPSTLLAACDSCIGGKSSLNYKGFKNLLGSFYPPDNILIYSQFFKTLTSKDYCSGLGEVVKFNIIAGQDGLDKIEKDIDDLLKHDYIKLSSYIQTSLEFKKRFIEEDEFDKGVRVLLNFAHTFGHAYEVVSNYAIPHGSAVALGMMTANNISVQRGYLQKAYAERIEKVCHKILTNVEIKKEWFDLQEILKAIHKDKKQTSKDITAVLIKKDYTLGVFHDIKESEIAKAIENIGD